MTGNPTVLEVERSTVRQTVGEPLVRSLPVFGRGFMSLATLAAGFTGNVNFPNAQGQAYSANNVLVDGASYFSKWRSAVRSFYSGYPLESVKQVEVLTNLFSAEFGEALASITRVTTKAGTNQFHGSSLLFFRDDALDALPAFARRKPSAGGEQYGFSLGGPLAVDRTHAFAAYEGRRARDHNLVVSPAAPNAAVPDNQDEHLMFMRVDHQRSQRQLLTGQYNGQLFRWHRERGGLELPGVGTRYTANVHSVLITNELLVSERTVHDIRVQFARYVEVRKDLQPTVYVYRAGYSIEGGVLGPAGFGADPEDTWEAADTILHWKGQHGLRSGGGIKYVKASATSQVYGRGAYFFAGSPAAAPRPFLFSQTLTAGGDADIVRPRSMAASGFVQDDWRIRTDLTLNLGVRYDIENVWNVDEYTVAVDKDNVQPRAGFAWDVANGGRIVVRGGVGVYSQQHQLFPIGRVELQGPNGAPTIALTPSSPLFPTFPGTLPARAPGTFPVPRDLYRVRPDFRNPSAIQSTIGLQRRLFGGVISADAVHLRGLDLISIIDANAPASISKPLPRTLAEADATRPIAPALSGYRALITMGNEGRSWYRALQVKFSRSAGGLEATAAYTWSKAEDMANYQLPEDSRNVAAEKGRAGADVRHNVSAGFTWEVPGTRLLARDWSVSSIGVFRSNRPYTITWGDDRNGTTQNDARPDRRNTGNTGPYRTVDVAVTRRFHRGRVTTDGRLEVFNLLNAINYDQYVGELLSPQFSQPVSAFPKRRVQLAAIVRF